MSRTILRRRISSAPFTLVSQPRWRALVIGRLVHGSLQNGPVSPSRSRIAWFCSRVWGRQSGESRSSHQAWANSLSFDTGIVAPGARPPSHRSMCSSDRKRFMVLQVKTMSSHQALAGTRQWKRIASSLGRCCRIATVSTSPQSGQDVSMSPSVCRAAQIPNASQAQFAYHHRPAPCTRYAVGTAENGFAMRRSLPACRTSAWSS